MDEEAIGCLDDDEFKMLPLLLLLEGDKAELLQLPVEDGRR